MVIRSQLGWVDFSAEDRERAKHALKQLSEPGTLDELGIGALRDGFADLMFPGFSTIQTRAKYFITVPRIIRDYLQLTPAQQRRQSLQAYLEEQETQLADLLRDRHSDKSQTGISGFSLEEGQSISRQPSSIYWVGLRTWKIVDAPGSLNQFLRAIQSPEEHLGSTQSDEQDDADAQNHISRVHLDRYLRQWRDEVCIQLTKSEAQFLSDKIKTGPVYSLPTQFEQHGLRPQVLQLGQATDSEQTGFCVLANWVAGRQELLQSTRDVVRMAHGFSELIYGAHLRFNMILARINQRDALLKGFEEKWQIWRKDIRTNPDDIPQWLTISRVRLPAHTQIFLRSWSEGIARSSAEALLDALVEKQARDNKKARSILNKRLPEEFSWQGMKRLDYRWWQVRTILMDVQEGLAC